MSHLNSPQSTCERDQLALWELCFSFFSSGKKPHDSLYARCLFIYHTSKSDLYICTLNIGIYLPAFFLPI